MSLGDVGDLVRHDGRDLARVVGEGEQAARHEDLARRQREGVDDRGIQDRDAIHLARRVAGGGELHQHVVDEALDGGRVIFTAEIGRELLVLAGRRAVERPWCAERPGAAAR